MAPRPKRDYKSFEAKKDQKKAKQKRSVSSFEIKKAAKERLEKARERRKELLRLRKEKAEARLARRSFKDGRRTTGRSRPGLTKDRDKSTTDKKPVGGSRGNAADKVKNSSKRTTSKKPVGGARGNAADKVKNRPTLGSKGGTILTESVDNFIGGAFTSEPKGQAAVPFNNPIVESASNFGIKPTAPTPVPFNNPITENASNFGINPQSPSSVPYLGNPIVERASNFGINPPQQTQMRRPVPTMRQSPVQMQRPSSPVQRGPRMTSPQQAQRAQELRDRARELQARLQASRGRRPMR